MEIDYINRKKQVLLNVYKKCEASEIFFNKNI